MKILLPVKYKIANGNSSGFVYKKSTRRATSDEGILATTRHFVGPLERICNIIFSLIKLSTNFVNISGELDVIITSISPEVSAPRRYDPTISILASVPFAECDPWVGNAFSKIAL